MIYSDNQTIIEFMGKAQKKISELTSFVIGKECDCKEYLLLKDLVSYIEVLDDNLSGWTLEDILDDIDYWNKRGELNTIPYLYVVGYTVNIAGSSVQSGSKVYYSDVIGLANFINQALGNLEHNSLKNIQGGAPGEYYHLTKQQLDDLLKILYPNTAPTVSLSIINTQPSAVNGVYEKGSILSVVNLLGSYVLNGGGSVLNVKYYKDNILFTTYTGADVNNQASYIGGVSSNAVFRYDAEFQVGGIKSATANITFELPYFTAVDYVGKSFSQLQATKTLVAKPEQLNVPFTLPLGNAMSTTPRVMYLAIPKNWGAFTSILVDNNPMFEYLDEWVRTEFIRTSNDGTLEEYYLYEYKQATQGTFNFNFKWQ